MHKLVDKEESGEYGTPLLILQNGPCIFMHIYHIYNYLYYFEKECSMQLGRDVVEKKLILWMSVLGRGDLGRLTNTRHFVNTFLSGEMTLPRLFLHNRTALFFYSSSFLPLGHLPCFTIRRAEQRRV